MRTMKMMRGLLSAVVVALVVAMAAPSVAPAALAQDSVPKAAPTGAPAETQPLAAPTASDDVSITTVAANARGISIIDMFDRADPLVKGVFILLVLASVWSWVIIINKGLALSARERKAARFEKIFWSG